MQQKHLNFKVPQIQDALLLFPFCFSCYFFFFQTQIMIFLRLMDLSFGKFCMGRWKSKGVMALVNYFSEYFLVC